MNLVLPFPYRLILAFRTAIEVLRPSFARAVPGVTPCRAGRVTLVGAGPGSADLITLRGLEFLRAADAVFYDRLADPALLRHAPARAELVYVGKAPGRHAMPQERINALLVEAAQRGMNVVRLKCGDPGIFARGAEEAAALDAAGIPWDVVPGVTAACAAAASARSFLTERGKTERLVLMTGHRCTGDLQDDWGATARPGTTVACYLGLANAARIEGELIAAGWPDGATAEIVANSQAPNERVVRCRLSSLSETCRNERIAAPAIVLVRWPHAAARDAEGASRALAATA